MLPYLFNAVALALIFFVVWWFWLSKSKSQKSTSNKVKILVQDGVYQPARIELQANKPIMLEFVRKDSSPCSEYVIFDSIEVSEKLALGKSQAINLGSLTPGEYSFGCQMKMYTGLLIVK